MWLCVGRTSPKNMSHSDFVTKLIFFLQLRFSIPVGELKCRFSFCFGHRVFLCGGGHDCFPTVAAELTERKKKSKLTQAWSSPIYDTEQEGVSNFQNSKSLCECETFGLRFFTGTFVPGNFVRIFISGILCCRYLNVNILFCSRKRKLVPFGSSLCIVTL